jgi:hypothetical protein
LKCDNRRIKKQVSPAGLTCICLYQTGRRQATDECLVPSPACGRYKLAGRQADFLLTFAKATV